MNLSRTEAPRCINFIVSHFTERRAWLIAISYSCYNGWLTVVRNTLDKFQSSYYKKIDQNWFYVLLFIRIYFTMLDIAIKIIMFLIICQKLFDHFKYHLFNDKFEMINLRKEKKNKVKQEYKRNKVWNKYFLFEHIRFHKDKFRKRTVIAWFWSSFYESWISLRVSNVL